MSARFVQKSVFLEFTLPIAVYRIIDHNIFCMDPYLDLKELTDFGKTFGLQSQSTVNDTI